MRQQRSGRRRSFWRSETGERALIVIAFVLFMLGLWLSLLATPASAL